MKVPLADINSSDGQQFRDPEELDAQFVASIREHGLIHPLVVAHDGTGRYDLIAGRRRYRHAAAAGLRMVDVTLKGFPDSLARFETMVDENCFRRPWSPLEKARLMVALRDEHGWTQGEIAEWMTGKLGRVTQSSVSRYLKLLEMTPEAQGLVAAGVLSFGHAKELLRLNGMPEVQRALARDLRGLAGNGGITTRQVRRRVDRLLASPEELAEQRKDAGAREVGRVYGEEREDRGWRIEDKEARVKGGDPLVGLYLAQALEALGYLVQVNVPVPGELTGSWGQLIEICGELSNGK